MFEILLVTERFSLKINAFNLPFQNNICNNFVLIILFDNAGLRQRQLRGGGGSPVESLAFKFQPPPKSESFPSTSANFQLISALREDCYISRSVTD